MLIQGTFYTLPTFTNSVSVCPIQSLACVTATGPGFGAVSPAPVDQTALVGEWNVAVTSATQAPALTRTAVPSDIALQHDYNFTIRVVAKGGFVYNSKPIMYISGCTPSINITDALDFVAIQPLQNQQDPKNVYYVKTTATDRAYCVPILYEVEDIVDLGGSVSPAVTKGTCEKNVAVCNAFSLARTYPPRIVTFKVRTTITNNIKHLSQMITLDIQCSKDTNIMNSTLDYGQFNQTFFWKNETVNKFNFENFTCYWTQVFQPYCCQDLVYVASYVSDPLAQPVKHPFISSIVRGVNTTEINDETQYLNQAVVDLSKMQVIKFYVYANNTKLNQAGTSQLVQLWVIFDCRTDIISYVMQDIEGLDWLKPETELNRKEFFPKPQQYKSIQNEGEDVVQVVNITMPALNKTMALGADCSMNISRMFE